MNDDEFNRRLDAKLRNYGHRIEEEFEPGCLVTILIRNPHRPNANAMVSNDPKLAAMVSAEFLGSMSVFFNEGQRLSEVEK